MEVTFGDFMGVLRSKEVEDFQQNVLSFFLAQINKARANSGKVAPEYLDSWRTTIVVTPTEIKKEAIGLFRGILNKMSAKMTPEGCDKIIASIFKGIEETSDEKLKVELQNMLDKPILAIVFVQLMYEQVVRSKDINIAAPYGMLLKRLNDTIFVKNGSQQAALQNELREQFNCKLSEIKPEEKSKHCAFTAWIAQLAFNGLLDSAYVFMLLNNSHSALVSVVTEGDLNDEKREEIHLLLTHIKGVWGILPRVCEHALKDKLAAFLTAHRAAIGSKNRFLIEDLLEGRIGAKK
jgi:hypothetical protein